MSGRGAFGRGGAGRGGSYDRGGGIPTPPRTTFKTSSLSIPTPSPLSIHTPPTISQPESLHMDLAMSTLDSLPYIFESLNMNNYWDPSPPAMKNPAPVSVTLPDLSQEFINYPKLNSSEEFENAKRAKRHFEF